MDIENECIMTIGLRTDYLKDKNILDYDKTNLQSPDFSESICNHFLNKCRTKCKSEDNTLKCFEACNEETCIGGVVQFKNEKEMKENLIKGKVWKNTSGTLNSYQVKILNIFLKNMTENKETTYDEFTKKLEFSYSYFPKTTNFVCRNDQFMDCHYFVELFHKNPKKLYMLLYNENKRFKK